MSGNTNSNDRIKEQAFNQFNIAVTQEAVERIADQFFFEERLSEEFVRIHDLVELFSGVDPFESDDRYLWAGAFKRRDAEMMKLLGAVFYDAAEHQANPRYQQKLHEILNGKAKPALRVV